MIKEKTRKRLEETRALFHFNELSKREKLVQDLLSSIYSPNYICGRISKKVSRELLEMAKGIQTTTSSTLPSTLHGSAQEFVEFVYDLTIVGAIVLDESESFTRSRSAVAITDADDFRFIFSRIPTVQPVSSNFRLTVHKKKKDKLVGLPIANINSNLLSILADEIKKQQARS